MRKIFNWIYMSEQQLKMILFGASGFLGAQVIVWLIVMLIWWLQGKL